VIGGWQGAPNRLKASGFAPILTSSIGPIDRDCASAILATARGS
jgi:hypothetical protein